MRPRSPFEVESLQKQVQLQLRHGWNLEADIPWAGGIDLSKSFVPLDPNNICFPGLAQDQRRVFSQFLGLVINETILEMEEALPKLRFAAWEKLLVATRAPRELKELGEIFFDEEEKHSRAFQLFRDQFCHQTGIEPKDLKSLLPSGFGSNFMSLMRANAEAGGTALWWVVASVEEISVKVYRAMAPHREVLDPLFVVLHRLHAEEETRHENYAFLMIELAKTRELGIWGRIQGRTETLLAELVAGPWVVTELSKIFRAKEFSHPFFRELSSCLPHLHNMKPHQLVRTFLWQAPYISWLINPAFRQKHREVLSRTGALSWPIPERKISTQELKAI